jgi:hypothetical protein
MKLAAKKKEEKKTLTADDQGHPDYRVQPGVVRIRLRTNPASHD